MTHIARLRFHWGVLAAVHIRVLFISPSLPLRLMCTVSEIYRSINKTIKQQFSLLLPHSAAEEYMHFSFPSSRTLASVRDGEREEMIGKTEKRRWDRGCKGRVGAIFCRNLRMRKKARSSCVEKVKENVQKIDVERID